ncbi:MAG: phage tail protein, partial [Cyanothece sp. SIO2G6]|nr:phage tail protein [Cyanothece sp. SIO2G6]
MTYSTVQPPLSVQLVPMQAADAVPLKAGADAWGDARLESQGSAVNLRVCPGDASELIVQLTNASDRPVTITYTLSGNFPRDWCQVGGIEDGAIPAGQKMSLVLYFQIAADFFEHHNAVQSGNPLELSYQGQIHIHATVEGSGQRHTQMRPFNVFVRPDSLYLNFLPDFYR